MSFNICQMSKKCNVLRECLKNFFEIAKKHKSKINLQQTPSGSTVISSCTIETTQTSITCTTEEKTALQTVSNTLLVAQRIFTAFAVSILSELSESAGATPSSTELTNLVNEITTGTSTKAASSRNRNMLRQMVLDKMKN